ncbi:hypothetical protein ES703_113344 [subsurface metagenome]
MLLSRLVVEYSPPLEGVFDNRKRHVALALGVGRRVLGGRLQRVEGDPRVVVGHTDEMAHGVGGHYGVQLADSLELVLQRPVNKCLDFIFAEGLERQDAAAGKQG